MPTGNPSRVSPMGAVVAGRPVSVAKEIQKSRSRYWRGPPRGARRRADNRGRAAGGEAGAKGGRRGEGGRGGGETRPTARGALRRAPGGAPVLYGGAPT